MTSQLEHDKKISSEPRHHAHRHHQPGQGKSHGHHCMGRGPKHPGGKGHGRGGDGHDRHNHFPLMRGRKFSGDDVQLLLRHFLAEAPNYGYELIKQFTHASNGFYTPSPGVIYPALTYLEDLGHITVQAEGTRKRYSLASEGQAYLAAHQDRVAAIIARLADVAVKMQSLTLAMQDEQAKPEQPNEVRDTLHRLRHTLHQLPKLDREQQQQVTAILTTAIDKLTALIAPQTEESDKTEG